MSDAHLEALNRNLRLAHNTHQQTKPPANPVEHMRRGSPDVLLSVEERVRERAAATDRDLRAAVAGKQRRPNVGAARSRAAAMRTRDESDDDSDEYLDANGVPQSRMKSKRLTPGVLSKLKAVMREQAEEQMSKSTQTTGAFMDQAALMRELKSVPSTKIDLSSLRERMAETARSLGSNTLAKSLEAGHGTNNAELTGGSAVRKPSLAGVKPAQRKRAHTADELLKAASAALDAGAITASEAHRINHQVAIGGSVDSEMLTKLRGDQPEYSILLTKNECYAALSKALASGAITGQQAMAAEACLSMNRRVDDHVMAKLQDIHNGK